MSSLSGGDDSSGIRRRAWRHLRRNNPPLVLAITGGLFVLETVSVIQGFLSLTGKRIFFDAPRFIIILKRRGGLSRPSLSAFLDYLRHLGAHRLINIEATVKGQAQIMTQPVSHIAIFGAGLSGLAAYQRARDLGIDCVIDDDKPIAAPQIDAKDAVPFSMWDWTQLDALIISPGVPLSHPSPHAVVTAARAHNVEVISEIEFALRTGQWGKLVVITGTNGKSTTTALAGHILNEAGYDVAVGGNLAPLILPCARLRLASQF